MSSTQVMQVRRRKVRPAHAAEPGHRWALHHLLQSCLEIPWYYSYIQVPSCPQCLDILVFYHKYYFIINICIHNGNFSCPVTCDSDSTDGLRVGCTHTTCHLHECGMLDIRVLIRSRRRGFLVLRSDIGRRRWLRCWWLRCSRHFRFAISCKALLEDRLAIALLSMCIAIPSF